MTQALWYASRATGLVTLMLLSMTMALGAVGAMRRSTWRWPRFAVASVHRNVSLVAVVFLGVHIASAVIDPYAGIRWVDAVVPFGSVYHPFWLGLGATALDVLIAVALSSLARPHLPHGLWRVVHWCTYPLFVVAVTHALGIGGADTRLPWVLALVVACVLTVGAAAFWRSRASHPDTEVRRAATAGGRWTR